MKTKTLLITVLGVLITIISFSLPSAHAGDKEGNGGELVYTPVLSQIAKILDNTSPGQYHFEDWRNKIKFNFLNKEDRDWMLNGVEALAISYQKDGEYITDIQKVKFENLNSYDRIFLIGHEILVQEELENSLTYPIITDLFYNHRSLILLYCGHLPGDVEFYKIFNSSPDPWRELKHWAYVENTGFKFFQKIEWHIAYIAENIKVLGNKAIINPRMISFFSPDSQDDYLGNTFNELRLSMPKDTTVLDQICLDFGFSKHTGVTTNRIRGSDYFSSDSLSYVSFKSDRILSVIESVTCTF
jgi:hypothetical protein